MLSEHQSLLHKYLLSFHLSKHILSPLLNARVTVSRRTCSLSTTDQFETEIVEKRNSFKRTSSKSCAEQKLYKMIPQIVCLITQSPFWLLLLQCTLYSGLFSSFFGFS